MVTKNLAVGATTAVHQTTLGVNQMLDHSNISAHQDVVASAPICFSHEKKSSEPDYFSELSRAISEHSELIDGLSLLTGHGFCLDDFSFVLQRLASQVEAISNMTSRFTDIDMG